MTVPDAGRPLTSDAAIDELVAANRRSNATMVALVDEVRREADARDRKIAVLEKNNRQTAFVMVMVAVMTLLLLGLAIVNALAIDSTRDQAARLEDIAAVTDTVKQYELTGFYCIRTNPATADPEGEAFLDCMERLYPGGPMLSGR